MIKPHVRLALCVVFLSYGGYSSMGGMYGGGYGGFGGYGSRYGMGGMGMTGMGAGGMDQQYSWLHSLHHFTSSLGYLTEVWV